ncbi:MAG: DNA-formamidopyrimidine glycosylase family protein [Candidatus Taylorbacteria bacterium]|nr:DNA-formamidopyrimidine glycosylase family protein [Candidatus Taylorbacteria bacterium]
MPELPEVQTIVNELRKKIIGLRITDFWSDKEKPVKQAGGIAKFRKEIIGKKILSITRRAKFIVIDIEGDKSLFIHQKISGHLMYGKWVPLEVASPRSFGLAPKARARLLTGWESAISGPLRDERQNQYIRYIWTFGNGYQMAMSDVRRFSRVILVKDKNISNLKEIRDLGPEPLEISLKQFTDLFRSSTPKQKRGCLKQVLMDPFFIVGIGNIYSDEILWDAGYHPLSRVENLKDADLKKIYLSLVKILNKAIAANGSSVDDYRLPSGEKGRYQDMEKAYQQTGKKCSKKDGGIIQRLKVGGRSAHFCSKHQIRR